MKKKEKQIILLFSIILMIFFEPQIFKEDSFAYVNIFDGVYKILKLISVIIISVLYIKEFKNKPSKLLIKIIIMQLIMLLSTIIYSGDLFRFTGPALTTIVMCMIGELLIKKKILFKTLEIVNDYFVVCFVINLMSVVLIDFTIFKYFTGVYFMGIDNRFIFTLLPWITFEGLVSIQKNNKLNIRWITVFCLSELLLLYKFSVSAMISLSLFTLVLIDYKKLLKDFKEIFYIYIGSNICVVLINIQQFLRPILKIVHKDPTLSGRTYIWSGIIKNLTKNPLIGTGMQSIEYDKSFFYKSTAPHYFPWCKVTHGHNSIMTLLYRGGIISLLIYLSILYDSSKQLVLNYKNKYSKILGVTLIIIMITSIFDTMDFAALYFIIALIINIKLIKNSKRSR